MTTQASQRTPQNQILNLSTSPAVLGPLHVLLLDIEISLGPGLAFPPWLLGAPLSVQRPPPHYLSLPISGLLLCQICSSAFGRAGQSHCQPRNMQWAAPSSPILASISVAVTNASSSLLWLEDRKAWQGKAVGMALGGLVTRQGAIWGMPGIFRHLVGSLQRVAFPRCWLCSPPSSTVPHRCPGCGR